MSQANINPTSLKSLTIPLPFVSEQRVISVTLDSVDEPMRHARAEREALQSLKESTADALMTGRVRLREGQGGTIYDTTNR